MAKRPKLVWFFVILLVFGSISSLVQNTQFYMGMGDIPEGVERPESFFHYLKAYTFAFATLTAAVMLFLRKESVRILFLAILVLDILSVAYVLFFERLPDEYLLGATAILMISVAFYGWVTWYSFNLSEKAYYEPNPIDEMTT